MMNQLLPVCCESRTFYLCVLNNLWSFISPEWNLFIVILTVGSVLMLSRHLDFKSLCSVMRESRRTTCSSPRSLVNRWLHSTVRNTESEIKHSSVIICDGTIWSGCVSLRLVQHLWLSGRFTGEVVGAARHWNKFLGAFPRRGPGEMRVPILSQF